MLPARRQGAAQAGKLRVCKIGFLLDWLGGGVGCRVGDRKGGRRLQHESDDSERSESV